MKKFLCTALALAMSLTLLGAATVSAANDEVLKGTPTIDGVVDEIYKQSLTIAYEGKEEKNGFGVSWDDKTTVTTYALYDDNYLYLCADVIDDDPTTVAYFDQAGISNPYEADVVEFRLDLNGSANTGDFVKVGIDSHDKQLNIYFNTAAVDATKVVKKTSVSATGYVIECAIPIGVDANNDLIAGGELGIKVWLSDLKAGFESMTDRPVDQEHYTQYCEIINGEGAGDRVFYKLSDKEAKVEAPKTFDPALIAVVLTAASGAAFVVASKKH